MKKAILQLILSLLMLWIVPIHAQANVLTEDELSLLYTCEEESIKDTCITITQEEAEMLMKIAVIEDYTDAESQAWIIQTILNRVESPSFPNTVQEVLSQKKGKIKQFASYGTSKYTAAEPDVNSHIALAMVEKGEITTDALYFEASYCKDTWQSRNLEYVGSVGSSRFYK